MTKNNRLCYWYNFYKVINSKLLDLEKKIAFKQMRKSGLKKECKLKRSIVLMIIIGKMQIANIFYRNCSNIYAFKAKQFKTNTLLRLRN